MHRLPCSVSAQKYASALFFTAAHRKWLTFQHLLQAVPHDVDVLYPDELELDVGVIVLILVAFPRRAVCHGVQLQRWATQNSPR